MARNEDKEQMTLIKWTQQPAIRKAYPCLKLLFHIPNERKCSPQQGKILKLMGVKKGVPDLFLPVPIGKYSGLWIEMKTENGKPLEEQMWWQTELTKQGYMAVICYGWIMASRTITDYMEGKYAE